MTSPEDIATECARIANALKDMEAKTFKRGRVSLTEIMAIHTTPAASILFEEPELVARKCGMLDHG